MTETRVIHIIQHFKLGGIEQFVFSMLRSDVKNVYILAIEGSSEESLAAWPKLISYRNNLFFADKKKGFSIKTILFIKNICRTLGISTMHTHHIGPLIYGYFVTRKLLIKHVHTEHDVWHLQNPKNWLIQALIFKLAKKIRLVAVSQQVFIDLKSYFPNMPVDLIYNAVDTQVFIPGEQAKARKYFKLPASATIIGTAGRLEAIKGQIYLIEAMKYLPPNFYLIIAGTGRLYQTLLTQINNHNLSHRIYLLGVIENMNLFYQACTIFCLPSLNEGLPLALLEAQACDVPVVCSDVGSCSEAVDPHTGILVAAQYPLAIANACQQILEQSGNPRNFILKKFSFAFFLKHYKQLYKNEEYQAHD